MDGIERIRLIAELDGGNETLIFAKNVSKYLSIIGGRIEYNNGDLWELIGYFEEGEYFEVCEKLIKLRR
jgi:hypothetical protein